MNGVYSQGWGYAVAVAVSDLLAGGECGLFTDALVPTPATPLADFVAAAPVFTGYATYALDGYPTPINYGPSGAYLNTGEVQFNLHSTGAIVTDTAVGWYVTLPGATPKVMAYGLFASPIAFVNEGDGCAFTVKFLFGGDAPVFVVDIPPS